MSKKSDKFEQDIVDYLKQFEELPATLPDWMVQEGYKEGTKINKIEGTGTRGSDWKTDVLVTLEDGKLIKISAKLANAHFYGNWYGHITFIENFGEDVFKKLTIDFAKWANEWIKKENSSPFIGVSICFGERKGNTGIEFLKYFTEEDMRKIITGISNQPEKNANCLYISSKIPKSRDLSFFLENMKPISKEVLEEIGKTFKVACRSLNPKTEDSNLGKCVYAKYVPFEKLDKLTVLSSKKDLMEHGSYKPLNIDKDFRLNHNHIIDDLEKNYNIKITRDNKDKKYKEKKEEKEKNKKAGK